MAIPSWEEFSEAVMSEKGGKQGSVEIGPSGAESFYSKRWRILVQLSILQTVRRLTRKKVISLQPANELSVLYTKPRHYYLPIKASIMHPIILHRLSKVAGREIDVIPEPFPKRPNKHTTFPPPRNIQQAAIPRRPLSQKP